MTAIGKIDWYYTTTKHDKAGTVYVYVYMISNFKNVEYRRFWNLKLFIFYILSFYIAIDKYGTFCDFAYSMCFNVFSSQCDWQLTTCGLVTPYGGIDLY